MSLKVKHNYKSYKIYLGYSFASEYYNKFKQKLNYIEVNIVDKTSLSLWLSVPFYTLLLSNKFRFML